MKMIKNIITICLMVLYMLSMAHTLFHHQMHLMLSHAENVEQVCSCHSYTHHHHSDSLDHKHENQDEKDCKSTTQFIPASVKPQLPTIHIDVNSLLALSFVLAAKIESSKENISYDRGVDLLPPEPDIDTRSLRAPPVVC